MQPAQADVSAFAPVMVGDLVGAVGGGDIDLDHHQVGLVVQVKGFHVLVLDADLILRVQITGQGCQAQGRKERILDRPPEWAGRFGQGRQDHLNFHRAFLLWGP